MKTTRMAVVAMACAALAGCAEGTSGTAASTEAAASVKTEATASAKAGEVRRSADEQKAALKRAEAQVEKIEAELKAGKVVFQPSADPALLLSLDEYRHGKRRLADGIAAQAEPDREKLKTAYLEMLADVCVTHYKSIRYKPSVIKTLCGR